LASHGATFGVSNPAREIEQGVDGFWPASFEIVKETSDKRKPRFDELDPGLFVFRDPAEGEMPRPPKKSPAPAKPGGAFTVVVASG